MSSELKDCPMPDCGGKGVPRTDANGVDLVECSNDGGEEGDPCALWYASNALEHKIWQALPRRADDKIEMLRAAAVYLLAFVPDWAKDVPNGLCATMYGTCSADGDRQVKCKVDAIRVLLEG